MNAGPRHIRLAKVRLGSLWKAFHSGPKRTSWNGIRVVVHPEQFVLPAGAVSSDTVTFLSWPGRTRSRREEGRFRPDDDPPSTAIALPPKGLVG